MIITASSNSDFQISKENAADTGNIILNHDFSDGLHLWRPNYGCDAFVVPAGSGYRNGLTTAVVSKRNQYWHGLEQDITSRISAGSTYTVSACVGASGTFQGCINVLATLKLVYQNSKTSFLSVGKKAVSNDGWGMLEGSFSLSAMPKEVIFFIEGPPPGAHLLIKSVVISCSSSTACDEWKDLMEKAPIITAYNNFDSQECWEILEGSFSLSSMPDQVIFYLEGSPAGADLLIKSVVITCPSSNASDDAGFGVNIITNTNLTDGTNGWFPLENGTMSVQTGSPLIIPPMARDSHSVSAWVKIGQASGPQRVKVALAVDGQWVNGGQVEISDGKWHEIGGSFRIAKQPAEVMVCIQGPAAGVDLMVAGLQIFPVDSRAQFSHLKNQTAKIRKRGVILKFSGLDSGNLLGTFVTVRQEKNSFPFGSAINRTYLDNEDFNDFFVKNINWAVLANELKWFWTEPQQGNFNYKDGNDFLVENCSDTLSSPFEHILDLQERDAPVGGIGIQGRIDTPVGPIVCSALDKLGILGLPIWFNEVNVSSNNEYVRADDLEVLLREAYAHPAVEGIMLRGMWEMFMCRPNAHLVNAEGDLNEAGKRYLALKREWLSHVHGHIDEQGQFCFSGFHGSYEVDVITGSKKITKNFVVDKGVDALVISIDM
ncbi:hypothetical protein A4A49_33519 [Nicotiana attenuata]|uniref:CBM-cenC domain-containing protein n=1 Tax=Nicotiana attenuata TaxID=49451 RepID=A0A314LBE9_NICAT|nr:hypothetical protein A4A49_33519 [Nicotiana attenuata]